MNFEIYYSINDVPQKTWSKIIENNNFFLSLPFLSLIEKNNAEIQPLYFIIKENNEYIGVLYGHLINITGNKLSRYIGDSNRLLNPINFIKYLASKLLNVNVLFIGNSYLTNHYTLFTKTKCRSTVVIEKLTAFVSEKIKINNIVFTDNFQEGINKNAKEFEAKYIKIKVEPDMVFNVNKNWKKFDDYFKDISSKYKKRLRSVLLKNKGVLIKELSIDDIRFYQSDIQRLFKNVYEKSKFSVVEFNTKTLLDFRKKFPKQVLVFGCFVNDKIIAFSSEIILNNTLYAYFVGIDYRVNKKYQVYNKLLYMHIELAIKNKINKIQLGRTASEIKSTIGAIPIHIDTYVFIKSSLLRFLFKPVIKLVKPKKWIQRNPFKYFL